MAFILEYKIWILVIFELIGWIFLIPMGVFRYFYPSKRFFWVSTAVSGFFGYSAHITIPILMCMKAHSLVGLIENKQDLLFDGLIIFILFLGFTFGKRWIKAIDGYLLTISKKWKNKKRKTQLL